MQIHSVLNHLNYRSTYALHNRLILFIALQRRLLVAHCADPDVRNFSWRFVNDIAVVLQRLLTIEYSKEDFAIRCSENCLCSASSILVMIRAPICQSVRDGLEKRNSILTVQL